MIRIPSEKDADTIRELLDSAFSPSRYESHLRELVIEGDEPRFEWIVEREGQLIAYILYTVATNGALEIGYHLAPVAVHSDFRGQGIGYLLIRETLAMDQLREQSIFVLGNPQYYERFGFLATESARCPFDEDNQHFRALRWNDPVSPFVIGYAPVFAQAG